MARGTDRSDVFGALRASSGYEVADLENEGEVLREVQHESRLRVNPDDHPHLFLDFAHIDPHSEKEMCAFANDWGLLGNLDFFFFLDDGRWGESTAYWVTAKNEMGEAVDLWFVLREESTERLAVLAEDARGNSSFLTTFAGTFPEGAGYADFDSAARLLAWVVTHHVEGAGGGSLDYDYDGDKTFTHTEHNTSLHESLWIQFSRAIAENADYRRCDVCSKPMLIQSGGRTVRARYCSVACHMKAARRRKKEALELRAQKVPIRRIAQRVGSSEETVRKWIDDSPAERAKRRARKEGRR